MNSAVEKYVEFVLSLKNLDKKLCPILIDILINTSEVTSWKFSFHADNGMNRKQVKAGVAKLIEANLISVIDINGRYKLNSDFFPGDRWYYTNKVEISFQFSDNETKPIIRRQFDKFEG